MEENEQVFYSYSCVMRQRKRQENNPQFNKIPDAAFFTILIRQDDKKMREEGNLLN